MRYIVMCRDELGDCFRAHGTPNLEKAYVYPAFDWDDDDMIVAFYAWKDNIEERLQEEWENVYGPESHVFLEREYADMSLADWARFGYDVTPL